MHSPLLPLLAFSVFLLTTAFLTVFFFQWSIRNHLLEKKLTQDLDIYGVKVSQVLREYETLHRQVTAGEKDGKFVQWVRSDSGLGNQIQGLVSCFLLSLVTKRILVIVDGTYPDRTHVFKPYFDPPVSLSSWQWEIVSSLYPSSQIDDTYQEFECCKNVKWPDLSENSFFKRLLCDNLTEKFPEKLLTVFTNQYFVPLLMNNPHYAEELNKVFNGNVFTPLQRYLFTPRSKIFRTVQQFVEQNFANRYVIGMHIRDLYYEEKSMPNPKFIKTFWKIAQTLTPEEHANNSIWFLSTDSEQVRRAALSSPWKDKFRFFNSTLPHSNHIFSSENKIARVIDNWILSECDELILTSPSSFGYIAAGRRHGLFGKNFQQRVPYWVSGLSRQVRRSVAYEPCFHFWADAKKLKCYNETKMWANEDFIPESECNF